MYVRAMKCLSVIRPCTRIIPSSHITRLTSRPAFWNRSVILHQPRMASSTAEPRFAEGEDAAQLGPDMQSLLQQQGWALDADGMGITKTFHFKTYFKAVVRVQICKSLLEGNLRFMDCAEVASCSFLDQID